MSIAVSFDPAGEDSAFALAASWQAGQLERIVAIRAEIAGLEAEEVRVLAGLLAEAEGEAGDDALEAGDAAEVTRRHDLAVRSLATELAASTRTSLTSVQGRLGEAWVLSTQLQATLEALAAGELSRAHAHELVTETDHLGARRAEAEELLLPLAKTLPPSQFRRRAKRALETLAKESVRVRHERAFAKRRVQVAAGRDGMAHLEAYLDACDAAVIKAGLTNAAAEARTAGDSRTAAQLQADLLVELLAEGEVTIGAHAAADAGADTQPGIAATAEATITHDAGRARAATTGTLARRAPVSVEVLIPAAVLTGDDTAAAGAAELPGLGVIDPARARRLVARAPSLRRILTDPITSAIIDFDRKTYRVPAELKRLIARRDGHCRAPGCAVPLTHCELDHTQAAARGGPTALWNLAHLCANHHHLKHEAGWGLKQYLGGYLQWRAPSGRRYTTFPEVNITGPPGQPIDPWQPPDTRHPAPFDLPGNVAGRDDDRGRGQGHGQGQGQGQGEGEEEHIKP